MDHFADRVHDTHGPHWSQIVIRKSSWKMECGPPGFKQLLTSDGGTSRKVKNNKGLILSANIQFRAFYRFKNSLQVSNITYSNKWLPHSSCTTTCRRNFPFPQPDSEWFVWTEGHLIHPGMDLQKVQEDCVDTTITWKHLLLGQYIRWQIEVVVFKKLTFCSLCFGDVLFLWIKKQDFGLVIKRESSIQVFCATWVNRGLQGHWIVPSFWTTILTIGFRGPSALAFPPDTSRDSKQEVTSQ